MKPSGIGGMAVMEGVMMKNKDIYAVAVRKPDNGIAVEMNTHKDLADKVKLFKMPVFRGMLAFVDSMLVGVKVLNYSASFFDDEADDAQNKDKKKNKTNKEDDDFIVEEVVNPYGESEVNASKVSESAASKKEERSNALLMALVVLISIVMSVALFMVLPVIITNFFSGFINNRYVILFIEGIVRLGIFIGYVFLASRMNEIKRVFMYHGAEHKTINCLENGFELTVENVRWQSKQHKRCGTSFMLLVILISLVFFMFIPITGLLWKIVSRVLLVPFIAGISYEFIRLAGKSESKVVHVLSQPGLWMQGLTTKEPDDSMIEVAIQSVSAVFDWKVFVETSATEESKGKKVNQSGNKQVTSNAKASKQSVAKQSVNSQAPVGKSTDKNIAGKNTVGKNTLDKNTLDKNILDKNTLDKNTLDKNTLDKNTAVKKQETVAGKPVAKKSDIKPHTEIKPQVGGLAYTGKVESDKGTPQATGMEGKKPLAETQSVKHEEHHNTIGRNMGMAPVSFKPNIKVNEDEEDDEILKALDKFFDDTKKER